MKRINQFLCILCAVFLFSFSALCLFLPKQEWSDSERRKLAAFPTLNVQTLINGKFMSEFESYAVDGFPFRDSFRTLKAVVNRYVFAKKDNNGVYMTADGYISSVDYPLRETSLERAASRFAYLYETYLSKENNRVYFSIIPDREFFLAKENGQLCYDFKELENYMKENVSFAQYIDISSLLQKEDYYKTDVHWKQECITDIAQKLAESMDTLLSEPFEENILEKPFYGVYCGQAAMPVAAEEIKYLTNDSILNCKVYDMQNGVQTSVYDREKGDGKDPYELFLSGPISLITIENSLCKNGKELIMFRDSFASSLAPLLTDGYEKITLIDIRYISPQVLSRFVDFENSDVLFLYSTRVLNNSETFK